MIRLFPLTLLTALLALVAGCGGSPAPAPGDATAQQTPPAAHGHDHDHDHGDEHGEEPPALSAEELELVAEQQFCPVGGPLGSMGTPVKVMVGDQPYFLCCEHCREPFLEDPDKYLAKLEEKKAKAREQEATKSSDAPASPEQDEST